MGAQENEQAVIAWFQENAIPLQYVEAGNGFADLQPLKQILKDVKVVGLGEATHGTREFFQLKHRLVEFLVTEMGFDTFTIEAGFGDCEPINEFVLDGRGDRAAALSGQGYIVWDTEEVSAMLDWMRAYNQRVPDEQKVKFHGVDITHNRIGRQAVLDYLRRVAPERVAATETLFEALARKETNRSSRIDEESEKALVELMPGLQAEIDHLAVNKDEYVSRTSAREFALALQYLRVMKRFVLAYAPELRPPQRDEAAARSICMAETLIDLIEQAPPDARFIIWEHNVHIG